MLEDLKALFRGNNFIGQMILINAGVFLLVNIVAHLFMSGNESTILYWLALPAMLTDFIKVPWTVFSYMFMHGGLWHIVFNMYMLYWFGRIFGSMLGEQRLIGLYFLGGLAGGALYLLVFNMMFLAGESMPSMYLVGASAAVMAIVIASGARFPDYVVNLMFFGAVRLKYLALIIFILSTVLDFSSNMGGKIAHLGGAAIGFWYARSLNQGNDFALRFYEFFARIQEYFKQKPKLKVVQNEPKVKATASRSKRGSSAGNAPHDEIQARTDAILDKISKSGYENLSKEEKDFLFKLSNNSK